MVNETVLLDSLVALTVTCKQMYIMLGAVGSECAALRETVRGLDPTFDEVLEKKREATSMSATSAEIGKMLDDAILKLKDDLIR